MNMFNYQTYGAILSLSLRGQFARVAQWGGKQALSIAATELFIRPLIIPPLHHLAQITPDTFTRHHIKDEHQKALEKFTNRVPSYENLEILDAALSAMEKKQTNPFEIDKNAQRPLDAHPHLMKLLIISQQNQCYKTTE